MACGVVGSDLLWGMTTHPLLVTGACFWTLEAIFAPLKGVESARCGHIWMAGGLPAKESSDRFPVERLEALRFDWDGEALPPDRLVEVLLAFTSAQLSGWEALDELSGMRSLIAGIPDSGMWNIEAFRRALAHHQSASNDTLHTQLTSAMPSWQPASEWDQQFFKRRPTDGFSCSIIAPKVHRLRQTFPDLLRS